MRWVLTVLLLTFACGRGDGARTGSGQARLTAAVREWLRSDTTSTTRHRVLVDLTQQVDLGRLRDSLDQSGARKLARRHAVVTSLQQLAAQSQRALDPLLRRLQRRGEIDSVERFVVVNRLVVVASVSAIAALAESPDVALISEERTAGPTVLSTTEVETKSYDSVSWALDAIGARSAWRTGLNGHGVVVGIIDAGVSSAHDQLRGNYRGGARSWFDPVEHTERPADILRGHGTGVLSAAVGQPNDGRTIGVAPGAQWIACAGLPEGHYSNVTITACADWMLTVGQPDVLINPWQLPGSGCDRSVQRIVEAWRAAEILPVFAAGNHGPGAQSDRSPANYALSVGAIRPDGTMLPQSSRGPNSCDGSTYPSLVAPGAAVPVAYPLTSSSYIRTEGTSVAAGLVAGVAALLVQRVPDASASQLEQALRAGSVDVGPRGPDNSYGAGRISVVGALAALERMRAKAQASSASVPTRQP